VLNKIANNYISEYRVCVYCDKSLNKQILRVETGSIMDNGLRSVKVIFKDDVIEEEFNSLLKRAINKLEDYCNKCIN